MFGRMMNETLGKVHFWGTIIAFNGIFIAALHPRRGRRPPPHLQLRALPVAVAPEQCAEPARPRDLTRWSCCSPPRSSSFVNMIKSLMERAKSAGNNPWNANTLEWQAPSPPPHGNFARDADRLSWPVRVQHAGP
jgi:cytochrome c oxidase subunit 1